MREHRMRYDTPPRDVAGGCGVCVCTVSAGDTPEQLLLRAVTLVNVAALRTFLTGVSRVDNHNRDSVFLCLVFDKGAELPERPVMQTLALFFGGLNPLTDMLQVFKTYREIGAFGSENDLLADAMVDVLLIPRLFTAVDLETTPGGASADSLQGGAPRYMPCATSFNSSAAELAAIGASGYVHDAKVHAEHPAWREQLRVIEVTDTSDIPLAANKHQVGLAFPVFKQRSLVFAADKRNLLASGECPQVNRVTFSEAQDTVIERLRRPLAKLALSLAPVLELIGVRYFRNTAHRSLSGKPEFFAHCVVVRFVQGILTKCLGFKSHSRKPITCLVTTLKRIA